MTRQSFAFATAGRISFGAGTATEIPGAVIAHGRRVLVVTGSTPSRYDVLDALDEADVEVARLQASREPTVDDAREAALAARGCDVVLGLGGGSVLDLAKAAGALVACDDVMDHLEVIGRGRPLPAPGLPVVAVPTTAGTGSEVTANAVLTSRESGVKVSLRGPTVLPHVAIVDPLLTLGCSRKVTASAGLDAFTQCLEPLVSPQASPLTDGFARTGLAAAARSLRTAYSDGSDVTARTDMALCSLLGGMALANAKLGAVHGIGGVVGGVTGGPHGAICAALLPSVVTVTLAALRDRQPRSTALSRYARAADLVTGESGSRSEDLVAWIRETCQVLSIPGLSAYGLAADDVDAVVAAASRSSSIKGHPIELSEDELRRIVLSSM
ncbi:MAG: iron-containing alcohol dehydrogenase [Jiangellales bacterium]